MQKSVAHRLAFVPVLAVLLSTSLSWAEERVLRTETLFGVEYTFQDKEMVNEPGRMTMTTPHKERKAEAFARIYAERLGLDPKWDVERKTTWKPGWFVNVPGEGQHVINAEPVTIEVNTAPKTVDQLIEASKPIFETAQSLNLKPYVQPAAERSGMGHIHIGGTRLGTNPFYRNPNLLRNVMVYLHKHPSLLWGFAEAYDIGKNSNIETYHDELRQQKFQAAVEEFDRWYQSTSEREREGGFQRFLQLLERHGGSDFFEHYRFLNLEHVRSLVNATLTGQETGKITIELRNFRPEKSPEHTKALGEMLLTLMDKLSDPIRLETFEKIAPNQYERFMTGSKMAADWEIVKTELGFRDPLLDEMVKEAIDAVHRVEIPLRSLRGARLFAAYSEKIEKGEHFELRLDGRVWTERPDLQINGRDLEFEKVRIGGTPYWVSYVNSKKLGIAARDILSGAAQPVWPVRAGTCRALFAR